MSEIEPPKVNIDFFNSFNSYEELSKIIDESDYLSDWK